MRGIERRQIVAVSTGGNLCLFVGKGNKYISSGGAM
jgi:hypothetical protein